MKNSKSHTCWATLDECIAENNQAMKNSHSPLPWHSAEVTIDDANNQTVAILPARHEWEPNARLIVRAVNSHQALVDALQAIVAVLDGRQPKDPAGALMVAKSTLALATK